MASNKAYLSLQDLAKILKDNLSDLEKGNSGIHELDEMVDHARELYERMVVLRHKAFDNQVKEEDAPSIPFKISTASTPIEEDQSFEVSDDLVDDLEVKPEAVVEEEVIEEQADERTEEEVVEELEENDPSKKAANQTSLIDAIEEMSNGDDKSLADQFVEEQGKESLADKLVKAPIADLIKSITLNQKFIFINELFGGDADEYKLTIAQLNECEGLSVAMDQLKEIQSKASWEGGEVAEEFVELVQRRHVGNV